MLEILFVVISRLKYVYWTVFKVHFSFFLPHDMHMTLRYTASSLQYNFNYFEALLELSYSMALFHFQHDIICY